MNDDDNEELLVDEGASDEQRTSFVRQVKLFWTTLTSFVAAALLVYGVLSVLHWWTGERGVAWYLDAIGVWLLVSVLGVVLLATWVTWQWHRMARSAADNAHWRARLCKSICNGLLLVAAAVFVLTAVFTFTALYESGKSLGEPAWAAAVVFAWLALFCAWAWLFHVAKTNRNYRAAVRFSVLLLLALVALFATVLGRLVHGGAAWIDAALVALWISAALALLLLLYLALLLRRRVMQLVDFFYVALLLWLVVFAALSVTIARADWHFRLASAEAAAHTRLLQLLVLFGPTLLLLVLLVFAQPLLASCYLHRCRRGARGREHRRFLGNIV